MRNYSILRLMALALVAGTWLACGGGDTGGTSEPLTGGVVMGTVFSTSDSPIDGAQLSIVGRETATNGQGWFTLAGVPAGERVVVRATAEGYRDAFETIHVRDGVVAWVELHVAPVQVTATIDPATGGTVSSGTQTVTFPSDAFVSAGSGAAITEPVTVSLSAFDYSSSTDFDAFPGDFVGRDLSGTERALESLGFVDVTLRTASGAEVAIAPGVEVALRLDSALSATAPDTVPLWYFDEENGVWIEEGQATRQGTALVGSVSHFTTWNFDLAYAVAYLSGRVVDANNQPLAYAAVSHRGVTYNGGSGTTTDANGTYRIPVNPDHTVDVWAVYRGFRSQTIRTQTPGVGQTTLLDDLVIGGIGAAVNATFTLSWGSAPDDLDAHLWTPSGAHIYYGNKGSLGAAPYVQLNTDDTSSFGPEITTVTQLERGTYVYCVHNYTGSPGIEQSGATVTYSDSRGTLQSLGVPTSNGGAAEWWRIAAFDSDGVRITDVRFDGRLVASCTP